MQIEQLRAARDEMAASVHGVRDKVDAILGQLDRTEDEARAAALAVGDQVRLHGPRRGAAERRGRRAEAAGGRGTTAERRDRRGDRPTRRRRARRPRCDELFARIRAGSDTETPRRRRGGRGDRRRRGRGDGGRGDDDRDRRPRRRGTGRRRRRGPDAVLGEEVAVPAGPDAEIIAGATSCSRRSPRS